MATCPSTVTVPVRAGPSDALTLNPIVPGPLPAGPDVIAIHASLLRADQEQPAPVVIAMVPVPPIAAMLWLAGVTELVQPSPSVIVTT